MNLTIPDELAGLTYMVRHNPNCPKPFEVRLTGGGLLATFSWFGTISSMYGRNRPIDTDDVGYGMTLCEAAQAALDAKHERIVAAPARKAGNRLFREVWEGL